MQIHDMTGLLKHMT